MVSDMAVKYWPPNIQTSISVNVSSNLPRTLLFSRTILTSTLGDTMPESPTMDEEGYSHRIRLQDLTFC